MFRLGLLATLTALILTGCVSQYSYRSESGGDYYYAEPSIDDYDLYGAPNGSIGYGYPGGWSGGFTFGFGSRLPYLRYGYPYGYYGHPYRYPYYGPRIRRTPPPGGGNHNPPGGGNNNPPGGGGPVVDNGDDHIPWRDLEGIRRRRQTPDRPEVNDDAPGMVGRVRHAPVSMPERSSAPRPRMEMPRSQPAMPRRSERPERESGRDLER